MDDILKNYLDNTVVTKSAITSRLTHPITNLRYPTRLEYVLLKEYANDFYNAGLEPRFISLVGLRGVGKTTLLWQTANHIFQTFQKDIYFFNVNTLKNLGVDILNEINELIDILSKAELLNVLLPFGGLNAKIVKNKKAFFMSPSLRRALLTTLYGQNLPVQFRSKLIEDIIVLYLKRILTDVVVSYTTGYNESNPDFVIETREKPILLEIGTSKTSTKQIKKSNINYRYGIVVSNGITEPNYKGDCLQLPLSWLLLL